MTASTWGTGREGKWREIKTGEKRICAVAKSDKKIEIVLSFTRFFVISLCKNV